MNIFLVSVNELIGDAVQKLICPLFTVALPDADDLPALAAYWKAHYNTAQGKGQVQNFMLAYPG
ncbi:MAG: hypothetical protein HY273_10020 [Gammaproteobacteria bacterium]|nr:hypothetical protein [Gammaproteobacteria bacterium]